MDHFGILTPDEQLVETLLHIDRCVTRLNGSGPRSKFVDPIFEPDIFRKQMYCMEECTYDIVGTFRRHPDSFGAPGCDSVPP